MKKIIFFLVGLFMMFLFSVEANAQGRQGRGKAKLGLGYNYSLPMGSFKTDVISDASPRGFNGDLMFTINRRWSAGIGFGFQDYYQKYPRAIYETGNHEVTSAVVSNSVQMLPVLAKGVFTPLGAKGGFIQPYISAAAGLSFIDFRQYLGEFGSSINSASFMMQGGVGLIIPFAKHSASGFNIGADYNYVTYQKYGYRTMDNLSFHAGIHFPLR